MAHCDAHVQFDTEFKAPRDSLREGRVECKVLRSDCEILDACNGTVRFRIRLRLRITVRSGELVTTFHELLEFDDLVWLEADFANLSCEVKAAGCRCVVHRGRVRCSGCLLVRFCLEGKRGGGCLPSCSCGCRCHQSCSGPQVVFLPILVPIVPALPL